MGALHRCCPADLSPPTRGDTVLASDFCNAGVDKQEQIWLHRRLKKYSDIADNGTIVVEGHVKDQSGRVFERLSVDIRQVWQNSPFDGFSDGGLPSKNVSREISGDFRLRFEDVKFVTLQFKKRGYYFKEKSYEFEAGKKDEILIKILAGKEEEVQKEKSKVVHKDAVVELVKKADRASLNTFRGELKSDVNGSVQGIQFHPGEKKFEKISFDRTVDGVPERTLYVRAKRGGDKRIRYWHFSYRSEGKGLSSNINAKFPRKMNVVLSGDQIGVIRYRPERFVRTALQMREAPKGGYRFRRNHIEVGREDALKLAKRNWGEKGKEGSVLFYLRTENVYGRVKLGPVSVENQGQTLVVESVVAQIQPKGSRNLETGLWWR